MDNLAIARILREIADLLEIKADNPFKIRAYRNGADIVANHPHELAALDADALREIPGIGKDLAARIREIADTGDAEFHRELIAEFPPTILDLLHLQGVGPKTVATLYSRARHPDARRSRARRARRPAMRALQRHGREEGSARFSRRSTSASGTRAVICCPTRTMPPRHSSSYLRERAPAAEIEAVGSLRRGCEIVRRHRHPRVGRAAVADGGRSSATASSNACSDRATPNRACCIAGGFQVDLRLVPPDSRGAAMQYFTGSKAHNIALRDRAIGLGFKLNEYGLFRIADDVRVAGATEDDIYARAGSAVDSAGTARGSRRDRSCRAGRCPA